MSKRQKQILKIHVPGFFKNNPKTENKRYYLRLNNGIFSDTRLIDVGPLGRYLYIVLLTICSECGRDQIELSLSSLSLHAKMRPSRVRVEAELLTLAQLISITYEPPLVLVLEEKNNSKVIVHKKPAASDLSNDSIAQILVSALEVVEPLPDEEKNLNQYIISVLFPKIISSFKSCEDFADFLDNVINTKTFYSLDAEKSRAYIIGAIKKRVSEESNG